MPAPKGNQFWNLRSSHGRDTLFASPELMWEAACEYFAWCVKNPLEEYDHKGFADVEGKDGKKRKKSLIVKLPRMRAMTMEGLSRYLGCNTQYFNHFETSLIDKRDPNDPTREHPLNEGFRIVITNIREVLYEQKFTGAAAGLLNANIISRDLGLKDRNELTGENGAPLYSTLKVELPAGVSITLPSNTDGNE